MGKSGSGKERKAKKSCCQSKPRCKNCPIVLSRLAALGYADKIGKRRFVVVKDIPKSDAKAARTR